MNKRVETYLAEVLSVIRYKRVHRAIRDELELHIEELTEEYRNQGLSQEEAIERAIQAMGDASEIGQKLNQQHKPQIEWGILILTGFICCFGIILMYFSRTLVRNYVPFENYLTHTCLGGLVLVGVYFFDYTKLKKHSVGLYFAGVTLILICIIWGTSINGAKRHLQFLGFNLSVPAVSGALFLVSFCGLLERYRGQGFVGILKLLGWGIGSIALLLLQPSTATAFLLFLCYSVILLRAFSKGHFGGNRVWQTTVFLSAGGLFSLGAAFLLLWNQPHRITRILMFLDHGASDPQGGGWVYQIAHKLLDASRLFGTGDGLAEGSIDWVLPGVTTDYALLNLIYTFGWFFGALLLVVITGLLIKMLQTTHKAKNSFGYYLSLISCVMLGMQFLFSVLMNLGLCPAMEVSLPFVAYGGSQYLTNMFYVGLVLSVWRRNNLLSADEQTVEVHPGKKKWITISDKKLIIDFNFDE